MKYWVPTVECIIIVLVCTKWKWHGGINIFHFWNVEYWSYTYWNTDIHFQETIRQIIENDLKGCSHVPGRPKWKRKTIWSHFTVTYRNDKCWRSINTPKYCNDDWTTDLKFSLISRGLVSSNPPVKSFLDAEVQTLGGRQSGRIL